MKSMELACEMANNSDLEIAIKHDFITINKGRDGIKYAWYFDGIHEQFIKVKDCEIMNFTEEEKKKLFL